MANPAINKLQDNYSSGVGVIINPNDRAVTLDSVIEKTTITLGLLVFSALATWFSINHAISTGNIKEFSSIATLAMVSSFVALGLSFWISFKRTVSPPLVLIFAVIEGAVIGFISKAMAIQVGSNEPVYGAIVGTFITAGATLAVYKFFDIQVTKKMRRIVMIAMFSFVGISVADYMLHLFGGGLGLNGFGTTGVLFSFVGLGIALFMLIVDFDAVERSIEYRLPEVESWRLAFCLTVSLVWVYINLLRILTYFSND